MTAPSHDGGKGSRVALRTRLKGLHWGYRARKDGTRTYYYYAWKNGPLIHSGEQLPAVLPDDHPIIDAYRKAKEDAKPKAAHGFIAGLVADFRASTDFMGMADSTRAQWRIWLDRIEDEFGPLELEGMDDRGVRKDIIAWRDRWISTPRQADYALQVLKRLLSYGVDRGDLDFNRAKGIKAVSRSAERAELIWTEDDIKAAACHEATPAAVGRAIRLAALTGLRRGDLIALRWDQVGEHEIVRPTNKSRGRRLARIPLLPETHKLLKELREARGDVPTVTVLSNESGTSWTESYLTHQVTAAAKRAGVDRHLHDLRGTFVTRLQIAGFSDDEIAEMAGWSVRAVRLMRRTYVSQDAVAKARVIRLQR